MDPVEHGPAGLARNPVQHLGAQGTVKAGQPISEPAPNALGAIIHAPFAGKITALANDRITLTK